MVSELKGRPEDIGTKAFRHVREQLQRIHKANPDSRFVYLMALQKDNVIFLADAEPVGSKDYSAPGDIYADVSPWLHLALTKGIPFTEGPWADTWGEWVTGCAPIINPATGHIIAVLGIDINARNWLTAVARYRWFGIAISTLVLGIVVMLILGMYFQGRSNLRITQYNRELNDELTKRKLAEEALRESQRSLAEIIEFLPDATFVID